MSIDPRTPILVGAGAASQRIEDHTKAPEPIELIIDALERAADDAGTRELLARASVVRVPKGFPPYADPGRLIADRFGATDAKTELAEIGILQTTLFGRSAAAIAAGDEDVCLLAGGEGKFRALRAQIAGEEPTYTDQGDAKPDTFLEPHEEIMSEPELVHGLAMPVNQYALIDNAMRYADGKSLDEHRREIAELWAGMSRVAADNPDAWIRDPLTPEQVATPDAKNRMLAFPYTKRHNSQWNVDQAAGLILCSVGVARELRIPEDRWLYPRAVADANHMVPLCERAEMHRSFGFREAGRRAFEIAGVTAADVGPRELYSCFPAAVRAQLRELELDPSGPVTVTGGMAFAGGPLNNFVFQAMVKMAHVLRAQPGELGLVTAVSGLLTKQGVSLWSTEPGDRPFVFADVSGDVEKSLRRVECLGEFTGQATIASATVLYEPTGPRAVFVCDTPEGKRTIASTPDPEIASDTAEQEVIGRTLDLAPGHVAWA